MNRLPTLYIRNVPTAVYEMLERRATHGGRSISAEALAIISEVVLREQSSEGLDSAPEA